VSKTATNILVSCWITADSIRDRGYCRRDAQWCICADISQPATEATCRWGSI